MEVLIRWRCSQCLTVSNAACEACKGKGHHDEWLPVTMIGAAARIRKTAFLVVGRRLRSEAKTGDRPPLIEGFRGV